MPVEITEICASPDGAAVFNNAAVDLRPGDFHSKDSPLRSQFEPVKRVTFMELPAGWSNDSVFTDRRQFGICMTGQVRFTMADGSAQIFGPGQAWRLVDVNVTGVKVEVVGAEPATCMVTTID